VNTARQRGCVVSSHISNGSDPPCTCHQCHSRSAMGHHAEISQETTRNHFLYVPKLKRHQFILAEREKHPNLYLVKREKIGIEFLFRISWHSFNTCILPLMQAEYHSKILNFSRCDLIPEKCISCENILFSESKICSPTNQIPERIILMNRFFLVN